MDISDRTFAGVGIVVRSRDGLVLVAQRLGDATPSLALPGGRLDPGESFEECAIRELAEETGLKMDAGTVRIFGCTFVPHAPINWIVVGARGEIDAPSAGIEPRELEPGKVGGFAWIDPASPPADLFASSLALLDLYDA